MLLLSLQQGASGRNSSLSSAEELEFAVPLRSLSFLLANCDATSNERRKQEKLERGRARAVIIPPESANHLGRRRRSLTHGHGFTASLGKKPTSFVDRILPCNHTEIMLSGVPGHNSGTISRRSKIYELRVIHCRSCGWREGGRTCVLLPPSLSSWMATGKVQP